MKKLLYLTVILSAMFLSASCQREGAIFEAGDSALLSFPSEDAIIVMDAPDGNKFSIELWRGNTKGAISVPVTISYDVDGVFTPAKEAFDFADGEAVATLEFKYDDINNFGGETYEIEVSISDETQLSPAGIQTVTISANRKLTPVFLGTGVYYSDLFEEEWPQDIYNTVEAPNYYILPDCLEVGTDITFTMVNGQPVFPALFDTGVLYNSTYGYISIVNDGATLVDGVITLNARYALPAISYIFGAGVETFTLPEGLILK